MIVEFLAGILHPQSEDACRTFFFCTTRDEGVAMAKEVGRGRVWSPHEIAVLRAMPKLTREEMTALIEAKVMFNCRVDEQMRETPNGPRP